MKWLGYLPSVPHKCINFGFPNLNRNLGLWILMIETPDILA